jgi:benzodiazapine receptor
MIPFQKLLASLALIFTLSNSSLSVRAFQPIATFSSSPTRAARSIPTPSSSRLEAASPITWALLHVIGGASGTPIVTKATKPDGWYRKIDLPEWTPPDRLFAPVWTTLYACMGVAAARVASTQITKFSLPMVLWGVHMFLNLIWANVFFGMKRLRMGMWINSSLVVTLAAIIPLFYQHNPVSAYLLLPYAAWLSFATLLNNAICKRNPTIGGYNAAKLQSDLIQLQQDASTYAGIEE